MRIRSLFLSLLPAVLSLPAFAAIGPWVSADKVRARLVAATPAADGTLEGAIEIELAPGWKTYWRSPGDAGVPPRFDFSASTNAEAAAVEYPAPERYDDGYAASNIYRDRVVLPVRFTVADKADPVTLDVKMDIGICEEICIPVHMTTSLDVGNAGHDGAASTLIAAARAALPGPGKPGALELLSLKRSGGSDQKPEFEARYHASGKEALFVETPGDWFADPPKAAEGEGGARVFRFAVDRRTAAGTIAGTEIRLTLTGEAGATSRPFTLDAGDAKP
ncbi:MAG: hypothetical protein J0H21_11165 [Rhizobiales bacterium]|nr:hypothetical protein [Hyphomicrobiales bacterium]